MKLEIEIEDGVYNRLKELMPDVDLGYVMSQMWQIQLVLMATHPEEFMAVYGGTATLEQRQVVDNYMRRESQKVFERSKEGGRLASE